ncbi:MAG TPA: hypothetical protein VHD35_11740, partial [Chitinophagaceae bacterium]|nr:hypothetical protein [Chitinophagaceae bacterium]
MIPVRKIIQSLFIVCLIIAPTHLLAQGTRLLRQPTISATQIAFEYAGDIWIVSKDGGDARRITSTAAVEGNPHFSPDGKWIAFSSNRSGIDQVYIVPAEGGMPTRL